MVVAAAVCIRVGKKPDCGVLGVLVEVGKWELVVARDLDGVGFAGCVYCQTERGLCCCCLLHKPAGVVV